MTSVTFPNVVRYFGNSSGYRQAIIPSNLTTIGDYAFYDCFSLTSFIIPDNVTYIGSNAFYGCFGLTSLEIPNNVTSVGQNAFSGCYFEKQSFINNSTLDADANNYWGANFVDIRESGFVINNGILIKYSGTDTSITIPNSVNLIGENVFQNNTHLTSVAIPNSVTSIGNNAFYGCSSLTSVTIPNSMKTIGDSAFDGCSQLVDVAIPDYLESMGTQAFMKTCKLYVNLVTTSLLALWNAGLTTYEKTSLKEIEKSNVSPYYSSTQTTITIKIVNRYKDFSYTCDGVPFDENGISFKGLCPEGSYNHVFKMSLGEVVYTLHNPYIYTGFSTQRIQPTIKTVFNTASSLFVKGSYNMGDAVVSGKELQLNGSIVKGDSIFCTGLDPNTSYSSNFSVTVECGTYTGTNTIKTMPLTLTTFQPKVISSGNAIVAAESNLDDAETNVGFEWRRTDWTDDFASNTGSAYLYEGRMEGYIRNLNVEKLWKVRPYYESNSGNRYYGEWVGLDPTNTSYFEPTVHTYQDILISGNTANVKGYVMRGSDNITSSGFKYWSLTNRAKSMVSQLTTIPSDVKTVEATGNIMTAKLTDLEYETEYHYVAFVTTSEGETFYGEERIFNTGARPQMPETLKCATPVINYENGIVSFSCETVDVKYTYYIIPISAMNGEGEKASMPKTYTITVFAKKDGYEDSDVATKEIDVSGGTSGTRGDVNGDDEVGMPDVMFIVNYILNGKFPDEE